MVWAEAVAGPYLLLAATAWAKVAAGSYLLPAARRSSGRRPLQALTFFKQWLSGQRPLQVLTFFQRQLPGRRLQVHNFIQLRLPWHRLPDPYLLPAATALAEAAAAVDPSRESRPDVNLNKEEGKLRLRKDASLYPTFNLNHPIPSSRILKPVISPPEPLQGVGKSPLLSSSLIKLK